MQKIAIVGVGGMGTVHFNNYAQIEKAEVRAVVGPSEADRKRQQNGELKFTLISKNCWLLKRLIWLISVLQPFSMLSILFRL